MSIPKPFKKGIQRTTGFAGKTKRARWKKQKAKFGSDSKYKQLQELTHFGGFHFKGADRREQIRSILTTLFMGLDVSFEAATKAKTALSRLDINSLQELNTDLDVVMEGTERSPDTLEKLQSDSTLGNILSDKMEEVEREKNHPVLQTLLAVIKAKEVLEAADFSDTNIAATKVSGEGAFKVFTITKPEQYTEKDEAFTHYDNSEPGKEVVIAVLDTGIYAKSTYLKDSVKTAIDASGKNKVGEEYLEDISDFHGTKVAGQAIYGYGKGKIQLADLRVQTGYADGDGGKDNLENIAARLREIIENHGATVVTCSIDIDWTQPALQQVVEDHPEVLFMTTAGNNDAEFEERSIDGEKKAKRANALLVGGVTMEGKKHPKRGYGKAVDVMVPSGGGKTGERSLPVHLPELAHIKEKEKDLKNAEKKLEEAEEKLKEAEEKLKGAGEEPKNSNKESKFRKTPESTFPMADLLKDIESKAKEKSPLKTDVALKKEEVNREREKVKNLEKELEELKSNKDEANRKVNTEAGVSFGLPVVANIAAKMKLIDPEITPAEITYILKHIAVSKVEGLKDVSESGGIIDPVKAYEAAALLRDQRN